MSSSEIAVIEQKAEIFPLLDPSYQEDLRELIAETLSENEDLSSADLVQIKVPSGSGAAMWSWDDGEKSAKVIEGVVIAQQAQRNYWKSKEITGERPDCASRDDVNGVGMYGQGSKENPGGLCADCPMGQWQDDVPPPCKPQVSVLLMVAGETFPWIMQIPRTSITDFRKFRKGLVRSRKSLSQVTVKFTLVKVKGNGVPDYFKIAFEEGEDHGREMRQFVKGASSLTATFLGSNEELRRMMQAGPTSGNDTVNIDAEQGFSIDDEIEVDDK